MRIAYLVFAYKNPRLLKRTIDRLSDAECTFFIHIDRKSDLSQFSEISGANIVFSETRIPVYWAEFSGVEAILILIRQALASPEPYDYFVLLSGSEYPLRSREYIRSFLQNNRGSEFISMLKMPAPGKPVSRLNTLRFQSTKPFRRFATRALAKIGLARRDYRKYLRDLDPYSGITWWALTKGACQYICDFVERNPHVAEYFQNVFAPEETFFHTIIGNSPFRAKVTRNFVYEDWTIPGGHPAMITDDHVAFFESKDKVCVQDLYSPGELLFARKFAEDDVRLFDRLDQMIDRKEKSAVL